jgi:MFS family permease
MPSTPTAAGASRLNHWPLLRWFVSSAALPVPQAAGPVAFSLVALSLTGDARGGAAMILAMTLSQMVAAVPITRLGRGVSSAAFLRALVGFRALALAAMTFCVHQEMSFAWLIVLAAIAGSVNGAAYGYLRSLLNHLTPVSRMPRALGIAATLNEVTFVLAPVAASGLGSQSPVLALVAMAVVGALPALVVPSAISAHVDELPHAEGSILTRQILLWLGCAAAGGATVAAIEIGAVALALKFGYAPALAILFTVPLCLASVAGGVWVSWRNRMASHRAIVLQLSVMTFGSALVAFTPSLSLTVLGAVLIGIVLAPLATHYALILDVLAPPQKRPEVFALLRMANAIGIIVTSAILTAASLSTALVVVAGIMFAATLAVALAVPRSMATHA